MTTANANPPVDSQLPHRPGGSLPELETTPPTLIRPSRGWQLIDFGELWRYRELLYILIWRDVKVRYKQTILGAAWAVLQPLMMMFVFTIFFSRMAGVSSGDIPYPLFAYAGLLPWTFFATAITAAGNSVVASERLVTKIYFPRLMVPFASVGAATVDFVIAFGLLLVMMAYYHVQPGIGILLLPVTFFAILLTALGVGTLIGALNISYRDFRYVIPFLVQLWMFATPSVYMETAARPSPTATHSSEAPRDTAAAPANATPTILRTALAANLMTGLIRAFRAASLGGSVSWSEFGRCSACSALVLAVGCLYFRRVEDSFADII